MNLGLLPCCFLPRPCAVPPHDTAGSPQMDARIPPGSRTLGIEHMPARETPDRGSGEDHTALAESRDCLKPCDIAGGRVEGANR